jgi:hypothetical protein
VLQTLSSPVQSVDVAHSTHVLVLVLQTLASPPVQSVDARHSTHIIVVVSHTRATPVLQSVLDAQDATQALVVRSHT